MDLETYANDIKELQATADRRLELLRELYEFKLREDKGDPDYMPSDWWQDETWERVEKELSDGWNGNVVPSGSASGAIDAVLRDVGNKEVSDGIRNIGEVS